MIYIYTNVHTNKNKFVKKVDDSKFYLCLDNLYVLSNVIQRVDNIHVNFPIKYISCYSLYNTVIRLVSEYQN